MNQSNLLYIENTQKAVSTFFDFEELPSLQQKLSFHYLEKRLKKTIGIEEFNQDTLITLNLYNKKQGYNNAANILSDDNTFAGIDIVKFGNNINIINKRSTLDHMSILEAYDKAIDFYMDYYQYEEIKGSYHKKIELIPEEAFREALAYASIHRAWDIQSQIRIFMYDDRIEIISPGGLTSGITENEYLLGKISILRNPIISNVFYRLKIVEIFGTGILRINQIYENSIKKPIFDISPNAIQIILPVIDHDYHLSEDEKKIYEVLNKNMYKSMSEIQPYVPYGKTKVTKILKQMAKKGIVKIEGKGKATKYHL